MSLEVVSSPSFARRWQVILLFRGRDYFQYNIVAPFRESCSVWMPSFNRSLNLFWSFTWISWSTRDRSRRWNLEKGISSCFSRY